MIRRSMRIRFLPLLPFVLIGCGQLPSYAPPPPRMTSEVWTGSGVVSLTYRPRAATLLDRFSLTMSIYGGDTNNVAGITMGGLTFAFLFSYAHYQDLIDTEGLQSALSYQVHLSPFPEGDGGFTPGIEVDLGLHARHGFYRHSARVGVAWVPDIDGSWLNRWNLFAGSPHSTFLPTLGYHGFLGPLAVGATWYPGMTRFLLKEYRLPQHDDDTGLVIAGDTLGRRLPEMEESARSLDPAVVHRGDIVFPLPGGRTVRIMERRLIVLTPGGEVIRRLMPKQLVERYDSLDRYYWVVLADSAVPHHSLPRRWTESLRYSRLMALDTTAILTHYDTTGELIIRDDPAALRRLDEIPIPISHDMIFTVGAWVHGRSEEEE